MTDERVQEMLQGGVGDRFTLASYGYALDILVHDTHRVVRSEVARRGYRLDLLVHDEDSTVRMDVAKQGYGLDILVNDSDWLVQKMAERFLGSKRHLVETNFGTYKGNLVLLTWKDRYLIISGCYTTEGLTWWRERCEKRVDRETARKYTKIMKDIIEEEVK